MNVNKWYGTIGFAGTVETSPGVYTDDIIERNYYGEFIRNSRRWATNSEGTNDNLVLSNQLSIVADSFISENMGFIKYVQIMGSKWKITDIEINYPRLVLTIGGLYNG